MATAENKVANTKHTPGPWEPELHEGCWRITTYADGAKVVPAAVHGDDDFSPIYAANARLIAAAPELLDACEVALAWLVNHWEEFDSETIVHPHCLRNDIVTAIAKATGEDAPPA